MRMEIERRFLVDGRSDKPWRGDNLTRLFNFTYMMLMLMMAKFSSTAINLPHLMLI